MAKVVQTHNIQNYDNYYYSENRFTRKINKIITKTTTIIITLLFKQEFHLS